MAVIDDVVKAESLDDVMGLMGRRDTNPRILAGGTDLLLRYTMDPADSLTLIDVTGVDELTTIETDADGVRIGAAVKLTDIVESEVLSARLPVLVQGALDVAGPQIRNLGTLGGNVCNASPSADTIPPLLVLDAGAEYLSGGEKHSVPLREFFLGPGQTVLGDGGVLTALRIEWPSAAACGVYIKHSPRRAMDLAIVGVAVLLDAAPDELEARIALGAVAPTPIRVTAAEDLLRGAELTEETIGEAARLAENAATPIDDVRGSARYRRDMVRELVTRALRIAGDEMRGRA
jgi:CO/xanthine dehydrogenase FAD-binding subunit